MLRLNCITDVVGDFILKCVKALGEEIGATTSLPPFYDKFNFEGGLAKMLLSDVRTVLVREPVSDLACGTSCG